MFNFEKNLLLYNTTEIKATRTRLSMSNRLQCGLKALIQVLLVNTEYGLTSGWPRKKQALKLSKLTERQMQFFY